jgi:hypothetical protein
MTSTAKEPGTRGRPEKVRAAAIRRATLAGLAVILVSAGPAVAMAAPRSRSRTTTGRRAQRSCR